MKRANGLVPLADALGDHSSEGISILAAEPSRYDAYAAAIRKEFAHVPDDAYRAGRSDVLRRFAARPVIFPDAAFALSCEQRARENLARELASLRG